MVEHASELRPFADDDIGALAVLNQKLLSALDEMDIEALDASLAVDYRILRAAARSELNDMQAADWRFRDPLAYVPVHAIYQLLIHPVKNVQAAIKHRLQAIPDHLRSARALIQQAPEHIVPERLQSAIAQSETGALFIRDLWQHPVITEQFSNPARLQPLFDEAAHALDGFASFLEHDVSDRAEGDFAVGTERFEQLLKDRHFLDIGAGKILAFGEAVYAKTREELLAQTRSMQGDDDVAGLLDKIRQEHPKADLLLDRYRKRIRDAYWWLRRHDVVSMPQGESLLIHETPAFLKPLIPFAAYEPPVPGDHDQRGYYYVTSLSEAGSSMEEHNQYSIDLTCVHESWPGHHLQFVTANRGHAGSFIRNIHTSATMYEGWALYCEELMLEQGFLDREEHRFMMLRDRLWRALRVIIDVSIHTQGMRIEEAVQRMMDELGFDRAQAEGELAWYIASPTQPLCYATGSELIHGLRDHLSTAGDFDLKSFHDRLLSEGSIALPLVIGRKFGEDAWRAARSRLEVPSA